MDLQLREKEATQAWLHKFFNNQFVLAPTPSPGEVLSLGRGTSRMGLMLNDVGRKYRYHAGMHVLCWHGVAGTLVPRYADSSGL